MKKRTFSSAKYAVIALFAALCILCAALMGKVAINYNISDYLAADTETKISLQILEDEFGLTSDIQVVAEHVDAETAEAMCDRIEAVENVLAVNFDRYDENYFKNGHALFSVLVDGDEYSDTAAAVLDDIEAALAEFSNPISLDGTVAEKVTLRAAIEGEIPFILALSLCLVTVIMFITAASWLEPLVLLASSGVAVLINMGTNLVLGEISYITNAVGAILQLALSVDYSIVLLHSYRALKETSEHNGEAMMRAIREVVKPVSASALTTIAGLLALLFMSFRIGFDIGTVLMKGIVISAVTSLTLFPALLLVCDKLMSKTAKKSLSLTGKRFCGVAFKAGRVIVPLALVLIVAGGLLHSRNTYAFSDSDGSSGTAAEVFGQNNTVIVVYPNSEHNHENEQLLAERLASYRTESGEAVLENHTAYGNTVRERYDVELAARKLGMSEDDVKLLLALYHIDRDSSALELTGQEFVRYANELLESDADAADFASDEAAQTLRTLLVVDELMRGSHTAEQFHSLLTTGVMEGMELDLFSVMQMYGLYHYDSMANTAVDFETMLDFMIAVSNTDAMGGMFQPETVANLTALSQGIKQFNAQMEAPLTADQFRGYMYETFGMMIDAATAGKIYYGYYALQGQPTQETIPFGKLMGFLVAQNQIADANAVAALIGYEQLYTALHTAYHYDQFLPTLTQVATGLSGKAPAIAASEQSVQQVYIAYFYQVGKIPADAVSGRDFVLFVQKTAETNPMVQAQLGSAGMAKLSDLMISDAFLTDETAYDYLEMTDLLSDLKEQMQSVSATTSMTGEKISGIYVKYAVENATEICAAVEAKDLLDFVSANMDSNELLSGRLNDELRSQVDEAKATIADATDLFVGETYSRMLLSVALPGEGAETSRFVEYLSEQVKEIFGSEAHIAGAIVATYDLQESFARDNTFITVFTIICIFVIVMLVFRSISLPVVLVAIIQGAIWISMSTSLLTGPMFFMSYIVSTCILMGATIDYGILMSTNYVHNRQTLSKKDALYKSVAAAMPTVFTSGLILTICGFVVGFISSQSSISSVGILLGKGTLVSVIMITLVLPSVLYLLDGFILKLSLKKK